MNILIWLIVAILYSPTFYQLYRSRWENIDYTHAYFILPISLWLVWRKRVEIFDNIKNFNPAKPGLLPLLPLVIGALIFIFGWRQEYLSLTSFSLIPVTAGLVLYLYGPRVLKALWFPILYLLLLVPPPLGILDNITLPMRYGISVLTEVILKAVHYPITRDGLLLSMGGHEIYMGPACSGFRSLITMISLGLVYVYLQKGSGKKKTILLSSIIPLALLGNLIRVLGVCMVTYHFGEKTGAQFHDTSGFVIFIILIAGLMGLESLCEKHEKN